MNVEGEQNASASAPASPTTASTAAVPVAGAKTYRVCGRSDRYYPPAIPHPFTCAASAAQLYKECFGIPPQARPVGVRRISHTLVYHTPLFITPPNTPCGCSDVLSHLLVSHTPTFITPPNVPRGRSDVLSHPLVYHTPWGPPRPALYHRGYTRYHTPHRIPHPVIIFSSAQMYHRGCVILCSLRYLSFRYYQNTRLLLLRQPFSY